MTRRDPFLAFCFRVTIDDTVTDPMVGFFKSVGGLSFETEVVDWVPVDQVAARPLHAGFAAAWPYLRSIVERVGRPAE